jgi:uncharacterized protein YdaT
MKICKECGIDFSPKNTKGIFCSKACRQKDYRKSVSKKMAQLKNILEKENKSFIGIIPSINKKVKQEYKNGNTKEVDELWNEDIYSQINEIKKEAKPSWAAKSNWDIMQGRKIDNLKKQLK